MCANKGRLTKVQQTHQRMMAIRTMGGGMDAMERNGFVIAELGAPMIGV